MGINFHRGLTRDERRVALAVVTAQMVAEIAEETGVSVSLRLLAPRKWVIVGTPSAADTAMACVAKTGTAIEVERVDDDGEREIYFDVVRN